MKQIVIVIEGGLVDQVLSTEPVEYVVIDYDTEGAMEQDLTNIPQAGGGSAPAYARIEESGVVSEERMKELQDAVKAEV